jgi:AcrR family transcriptional regulator
MSSTATAAGRSTGARRGEGTYDERRDLLAESALTTLGQRGYAHTSLRDIAANSPFTHGVVHYYFRDKTELITYCVRSYKARCVHRYDDVVERRHGAGARRRLRRPARRDDRRRGSDAPALVRPAHAGHVRREAAGRRPRHRR